MNNFNIKELVKLAKSEKDIRVKEYDNKVVTDVYRFIQVFKLKDGKNRVRLNILFKAYEMWAIKPMKQVTFSREFGKFFHRHYKKQIKYFLLNIKPVALLNKADNLRQGIIKRK